MSYTRGALVCVCTLWLGAASAQSFPSRPIRLIVPVPPGGGADFVARGYAARLSESLGQQVVVDNRGGAAGIIAMDAVAKAAPDGYTLVQTNISTVSINPFIYPKLPYDAMRDFAPVSITTLNPLVLVVHPSLPVKTVKELIAYAKSKPGEVSYASLGSGSIQHLAGHVFSKDAGIQTVHVPYKGAAPATVDLLAHQVHMAFSGVGTVAGHVTAGRLRAIAVTGKRVDVFPNVPTLQEAGGPDVRMWLWNGILAPARTPAPVIARLNADIVKAARSPELIAMMATQGTSPTSNTPEEFARFIREEQARFARIVKDSGARAD
ncbi:MAG TPA: tripartite tricarboxylate transporter substrate binding protein [Burkholderiales bacterium]|jgi:tripartite-type tricarboxylate transporter receptor subunit TctC|nr:tripartite tricarboxylate transporter substrate binding protein [Burkholderiales bacterium]